MKITEQQKPKAEETPTPSYSISSSSSSFHEGCCDTERNSSNNNNVVRRRREQNKNNNMKCGEQIVRNLVKDDYDNNNNNNKNDQPYKKKRRRLNQRFDWFLVFTTACGVFMSAPLYGFNVYIEPLLNEFSSTDNATTLTMKDGSPVYVAGLALLFCTIGNFVVAPRMETWGFNVTMFLGICISSFGLVLTFLSTQYHLLWLFYLGYGIIFGTGTGFINIPLLTNMVTWYRYRRSMPGLGSGLFGVLPGLWSALFSYVGPAIYNSVGISYSFLILAAILFGLGFWVPGFVYTPQSIQYHNPNIENEIKSQHDDLEPDRTDDDATPEEEEGELSQPAGSMMKQQKEERQRKQQKKEVNNSPPNARADNALSGPEIVRTKQFWLILVLYFLAFFPGFGVKLVISPLMKGVFNASGKTQSTVSALFLLGYSFGRFIGGPISDNHSPRKLLIGLFLVQSIVCVILGIIVYFAATGQTGVWSFAVVNMVLGFCLAGEKTVYSVFVLTIFGAPSLGAAMGRLFVGLGFSAFSAPIAMWAVLVSASENLNGSNDDSIAFTRSVSAFFWVGSFITLVSVGLLFAVHPCQFEPLEASKRPGDDVEEGGLCLSSQVVCKGGAAENK